MSVCGCCGGCGCQACGYVVNLPDNPVAEYSATNGNTGGIGVYDSTVGGVQFVFRGISSANSMAVITLDAGNKNVLITLDATAIAAAFPAATTTQSGILETATDAEAIAKAATDKIVTPSNFAAMAASTTFAGFAEIATQAEVNAGVDAVRYVAPDTLGVLLGTKKYTTTFADSVARAAAVPAFEGQFGYQIDSNTGYVANGSGAGDWAVLITDGATQTLDDSTTVSITLNLDFIGAGTLNIGNTNTNFSGTTINSSAELNQDADVNFSDSNIDFTNCTLTFAGGSNASSVLVTDVGDQIGTLLIDSFVSEANVDSGWTVANLAVNRTLDCATATLGDLRNIVGTLITAFLNTLKPHA